VNDGVRHEVSGDLFAAVAPIGEKTPIGEKIIKFGASIRWKLVSVCSIAACCVNTVSPSLKTQIKRVGTLSNRKIEIESERDVQLRPILPNETVT